ncbi:hypothetical protein G9P44_004673 [Scheffersomyces stipitis]|nr:hypothetical protein G9P44_004673 [Scheffersomyces stipitis]
MQSPLVVPSATANGNSKNPAKQPTSSDGPEPSKTPKPTVNDGNKQEQTSSQQTSRSGPLAAKPTRQFKLISVNFKEASLDSPSFRATINHLDTQVVNIEKWILALSSSIRKIPSYIKEVQSFCNSFLEHLVPSFIQDGLIDQEYTVQSLNTTLSGLKKLWAISLSSLNVNTYTIDNIRTVVSKNVAYYKELREKFDASQQKYDKYLEIYVSTSKTKDVAMAMEDAKQLHVVRKEYLHASLDLIIELSALGNHLDKVLVNLSSDLWKYKFSYITNDALDPFFKEQYSKIQKIQSWSDSYSVAIDKLQTDMQAARAHVEESSGIQFTPSSNPNDYSASMINSRTLNDIDERGVEKHGYLFMKTWNEKSNKPVWVRRWAFIKGGVFGMLILSSTQTFVQETDKMGILLCNVKYAPNEDRRFCFEVKTSNISIVFQAETLIDLKTWLKVFENEKNRILSSGEEDQNIFAIASGRYPPIVSEFASTINTVVDKEMTSTRIINSSGQIITSSHLSSHIEKNEKFFQKYVYSQIPQIRPPFMTETTKSSIIAYSLASATSLPTALTANIWGSVNWGLYYLHDAVVDHLPPSSISIPEAELIEKQLTHKDDSGSFYPVYYPHTLVAMDIQMRALFETAVEPGEYCLVSFRCIWSPNSKQELSGRCFITTHHIYFYMQALGFVALFKGYVGNLVSVDHNAQKSYDLLKIYSLDGVIKTKLFLDDGKLIKQKTVYLINNLASDKPKKLAEVLKDLERIEVQVKTEQDDQSQIKLIQTLAKNLSDSAKAEKVNFVNINGDNTNGDNSNSFIQSKDGKLLKFQIDFRREYGFIGEKTYDLVPKAIFHALLGDNSVIFKDQTAFTTLECFIKKPWRVAENGNYYRSVNAPANFGNKQVIMRLDQVIDNIHDNQYYTFTHKKSTFKFFMGSKFSITYKFVIVGVAGKQSKVYFYCKRDFQGYHPLNLIIDRISIQIANSQINTLDKRLKDVVMQVGNHGMIVKAIYLYGKLSQTTVQDEIEEVPVIYFGLFNSLKVVSKKVFHSGISFFIWFVSYLIMSGKYFLRSIRMNQFLTLITICLGLFNIFLLGKTSTAYWHSRMATQMAYEFVKKEPVMLQRAIYLKDIQDLLSDHTIFNNSSHPYLLDDSSRCLGAFKEKSFVYNLNEPTYWDESYGDEATMDVAKHLKNEFRTIGVKRHELLVQLSILRKMEEEIAKAEWKNWLMSEVQRCEFISANVIRKLDGSEREDIDAGVQSIQNYCNDCSAHLSAAELL